MVKGLPSLSVDVDEDEVEEVDVKTGLWDKTEDDGTLFAVPITKNTLM